MKFKEFVVNSLPRVRSRRKKAHLVQKTVNNEQQYDKNRNRFGPKLTWEKTFGVVRDHYALKQDGGCEVSLQEAVKTVCGQIIDTFRYQDTSSFTYHGNLSQPFSLESTQNDNIFSFNRDAFSLNRDTFSFSCDTLTSSRDNQADCNTVPKSRSRIRTNPWIPSPKSSSTSSSESCSNCTSSSTSPALSPSNKSNSYSSKSSLTLSGLQSSRSSCHQRISNDLLRNCGCLSDVTTKKQLNNLNCGARPYSDSDDSSDLSPNMEFCSSGFDAGPDISFEYEESLECCLEKSSVKRDVSLDDLLTDDQLLLDVAVQTDFTDDDVDDDRDWPPEDAMIQESEDVPRCVDCMQDSTDTGYSSLGRDGQFELDDEFQFYRVTESSPLDLSSNGSVSCTRPPAVEKINFCGSEGNIPAEDRTGYMGADTFVGSPKQTMSTNTMTEHPLSGDGIKHTDTFCQYQKPSEIDNITGKAQFDQYWNQPEIDDVTCKIPCGGYLKESEIDDVLSKTPRGGYRKQTEVYDVTDAAPTGRSTRQVASSLEVKVTRLRREKQIMEEKIRQAREEERQVEVQRSRLQQLVAFHRKEILLQTLSDLTERLDDQGCRLQASYAIVLSMQQRFAQHRSQGLAVRHDIT